jgi:nucleotide-binding universal stress UspA family protein
LGEGGKMKILVAYNAADGEKEGLVLGLKQAKAFKAEVIVLASLMVSEKGYAFDSRAKEDAMLKLSEAKKFYEEAGVSCSTELMVRGKDAGEDIVEYAKEKQVDLIVVGVRIRSRVGKMLLGSTAQYVILKASCPVLTYKELPAQK